MSANEIHRHLAMASLAHFNTLPDPGNANEIFIGDVSHVLCLVAAAGAGESRSLPSAEGLTSGIYVTVIKDGSTGDIGLFVPQLTGNATYNLSAAFDSASFFTAYDTTNGRCYWVPVVNSVENSIEASNHKRGTLSPVSLPVDSAVVIEAGDLIYIATDDARPASSQSDVGSLVGNQEAFHDLFVGVALQASANGETDAIQIATGGVFEFGCASATFELGDLIGVAENGAGDELEDQTVIAVGAANLSIGRCATRVPVAATAVDVAIASSLMDGGVQAVA